MSPVKDKIDEHSYAYSPLNNAVGEFIRTFDAIMVTFDSILEPQGILKCSLILEPSTISKLGEGKNCLKLNF